MADQQVTRQMSFDIGTTEMTDEITPADLEAFILDLGFTRLAPALTRLVQGVIRTAVTLIYTLQGPGRNLIGDANVEQGRKLAFAAGLEIAIPERDALVLNRISVTGRLRHRRLRGVA